MEPKFVNLLDLTWIESTVNDKSSVGFYRDYRLAAINNTNGPKLDRIRKDVTALFKKEGLSIIIERNLNKADFLDINLAGNKYFSFRKVNNTPLYINVLSKHPPAIIKQLPQIISKKKFTLPCNKEEFNKVKSVYQTSPKG